MSETTATPQGSAAQIAEYLDGTARQETARALREIAEARKELDQIEAQLKLAADGQPYLRIGRVRGVDAGAVFAAFGSIENAAVARNIARKES